MTDQRFRVPPYLSVLALGDDVLVGLLPPRAVRIEDAPEYLPKLLAFLSDPRTTEEVIAHTELEEGDARMLLGELKEAGIVSAAVFDPADRYARHHLYFDLLGADHKEAQRTLANATVGLVGMGGIGSSVAVLLAAAGVGTLVFSDGDVVEVSNLTRQTLYGGDGVGRPKVDVAAQRLEELNPDVTVHPVQESISGSDLFDRHFSRCDFVVLSADSPADVHTWTNEAALRYRFATSNAGYIEAFGVVGPMILPGRTACYECFRSVGDLQTPGGSAPSELNAHHQSPSFGPLNAMVAAMQANEVIRYLIGLPAETSGCRLLLDSATYELHRERFSRDPACPRCGGHRATDEVIQDDVSLADVYAQEREDASQNAIVLDPLLASLVPGAARQRVLDVGCGTGQQLIRLAQTGCVATGTDISPEMLRHTAARVAELGLGDRVTVYEGGLPPDEGPYDQILCLNVLDHVEDAAAMLGGMVRRLAPDGRLVISLPHPIKDGGIWHKDFVGGRWRYGDFALEDYFSEGPVVKSRENVRGDVVIKEIRTFHRTTATWVQMFTAAGLRIDGLWEPAPAPEHADTHAVLYEKSSRIPYFQVFSLRLDNA